MARYSKSDQEFAIERLRKELKPGSEVYTVVKHVSRSGMKRSIQVFTIRKNQAVWLGYSVAVALGWSFDENRESVFVEGCGMDMGFHLVYELSATIFHGKKSPKGFNKSPGFWLKQRWI